MSDFNTRNKCLTAKLLTQGYRYHKFRKTFSKIYCRHNELISKYNVGLKTLLGEALSVPEFYGDFVYKFKKLMRQSACLVFNQIMIDNYAAFFNCTPVSRAADSKMTPT